MGDTMQWNCGCKDRRLKAWVWKLLCFAALIGGLPSTSPAADAVPAGATSSPPASVVGTMLPACHPDWKLELIAQPPLLRHPSVVCVSPDGRVFVAEDPMDISVEQANDTQGRIVCVHPDGHVTTFAEGLYAVFGMKYLEGKLYVLHNPKFSVFVDDQGQGKQRVDLIESTNPEPWAEKWNDHVPANFVLGMDGFFYLAVGDKGLYGAVGRDGKRLDLHGGGVIRLRPDGTQLEIVATGLRNILDVAIDAEDELFTYDNTDEKQWMSRLSHVVDQGYYGYPYDFHPRQPFILWCMADYGPGAATGAFIDTAGRLDDRFSGSLFLADFGKRQVTSVRLERAGASFVARDPVELFPDPPGDFRPVGICASADGTALYVCDWQHADNKEKVTVGRLFRLTYLKPKEAVPNPSWFLPSAMGQTTQVGVPELIQGLDHPARAVRMAAQRKLIEMGNDAVQPLMDLLEEPRASSWARSHALWALDGIDQGEAARSLIISAIYGVDPVLRRQAIRQLGLRRVRGAVTELTGRLEDEDASIRFQAATALSRIGDPATVRPLIDALGVPETDVVARFAEFTALNRIGLQNPNTWVRIVAVLDGKSEALREAVSMSLRETYDTALVKALLDLALQSRASTAGRLKAMELASEVYRQKPAWKGEWWVYHPVDLPPPVKSVDWEGTAQIGDVMRQLMKDASPQIQMAALEKIGALRIQAAATEIRIASESEPNLDLKRQMLEVLGQLKDVESVPLLLASIQNLNAPSNVVWTAIGAVEAFKDATNTVTAALSEGLSRYVDREDVPAALLSRGLQALGSLGDARALPSIERRLADARVEVSLSAIQAAGRFPAAAPALAERWVDERAGVRAALIHQLGMLKYRDAIPKWIEALKNPATHDEAFHALAMNPDLSALPIFVEQLTNQNVAVRDIALRAIGSDSLRSVARPILEGQVRDLSPTALVGLQKIYARDEQAKKGPLFSRVAEGTGPEAYLQFAMEHPGDALNGQRLAYNTAGLACTRCHRVLGYGGDIGPDLSQVGTQFDRKALAESILWPSKVVREGYQQTLLELKNEEVLGGLVKAEDATSITVRNSEGKDQVVAKAEIRDRRLSDLSMMPEGLQLGLTLQEFADVVGFLEKLKVNPRTAGTVPSPPFVSLFTGTNLMGWATNSTNSLHWTAKEGVLEHDGVAGDLWTESSFADFRLQLEWRWPELPKTEHFPLIDADGNPVKDTQGKEVTRPVLDAGDSGVLLRGLYKAQANLFCYPVGSGEVWEYRTDPSVTAEQRRAVTPKLQADLPLGLWNAMEIVVRGDRMTVVLNGKEVISQAQLPGLPERGPIGLQHEHGRIQFRNLWIEDLSAAKP